MIVIVIPKLLSMLYHTASDHTVNQGSLICKPIVTQVNTMQYMHIASQVLSSLYHVDRRMPEVSKSTMLTNTTIVDKSLC